MSNDDIESQADPEQTRQERLARDELKLFLTNVLKMPSVDLTLQNTAKTEDVDIESGTSTKWMLVFTWMHEGHKYVANLRGNETFTPQVYIQVDGGAHSQYGVSRPEDIHRALLDEGP